MMRRRNILKSRIAERRRREAEHAAQMAVLRPLLEKHGAVYGHGSELAQMAAWAEYSAPSGATVELVR